MSDSDIEKMEGEHSLMYSLLKRLVQARSAESIIKGTFRGVAMDIASEAERLLANMEKEDS